MENTEKKAYTVKDIIKGADLISSSFPHEAAMLRQFAEMLERCEKMIKGHDDLIAHYSSIGCNRGIDINRMLKNKLELVLNGYKASDNNEKEIA